MSYPHLEADIATAPIIKEGDYSFKVFSAGERGTTITPQLSHEVINGLIAAVRSISDSIDSIVSIHVTGTMWALPVAMALNKPLKSFTTEPNGSDKQRSFQQKRPYLPRLIYTPDLSQAGRCIIIDDVLNRGGTITQMKAEVEKDGGTVLGAICVIDKLGSAPSLSNELGVPVISLARV